MRHRHTTPDKKITPAHNHPHFLDPNSYNRPTFPKKTNRFHTSAPYIHSNQSDSHTQTNNLRTSACTYCTADRYTEKHNVPTQTHSLAIPYSPHNCPQATTTTSTPTSRSHSYHTNRNRYKKTTLRPHPRPHDPQQIHSGRPNKIRNHRAPKYSNHTRNSHTIPRPYNHHPRATPTNHNSKPNHSDYLKQPS